MLRVLNVAPAGGLDVPDSVPPGPLFRMAMSTVFVAVLPGYSGVQDTDGDPAIASPVSVVGCWRN
jgi:hypothetical protein